MSTQSVSNNNGLDIASSYSWMRQEQHTERATAALTAALATAAFIAFCSLPILDGLHSAHGGLVMFASFGLGAGAVTTFMVGAMLRSCMAHQASKCSHNDGGLTEEEANKLEALIHYVYPGGGLKYLTHHQKTAASLMNHGKFLRYFQLMVAHYGGEGTDFMDELDAKFFTPEKLLSSFEGGYLLSSFGARCKEKGWLTDMIAHMKGKYPSKATKLQLNHLFGLRNAYMAQNAQLTVPYDGATLLGMLHNNTLGGSEYE